jgi:3-phosphoshikimate 1-carboxyvinyltransferase
MADWIEIKPLTERLDAIVRVPGSKSITNRALVIAALAGGLSRLRGALFSDDTRYMLEALQTLGFTASADEASTSIGVDGMGGRIPAREAELFVGNSGTTIRFLTALVALGRGSFRLDGIPRMRERPIEPLLDGLRQLGTSAYSEAGNGCPPVRIQAAGLRGGTARLRGDLSSQYFSALLLSAPLTDDGVTILVDGDLVSQPYVDLTMKVMGDFGVTSSHQEYRRLLVPGRQHYHAHAYEIEPDASSASYFFAVAALTGGHVRVEGLGRDSAQGDYRFLEILEQMGCRVQRGASATDVWGPPRLLGVEADMCHISDVAQTLAAIAPFADGPTTIRGIAHIRGKETERIAAMVTELRRLGQQVDEFPDGLRVTPAPIRPAELVTYDDHRMAMALALVGLRAPGIRILDPQCVAKTFPDYFDRLAQLRTPG